MEIFRTEVNTKIRNYKIDYQKKQFFIGSCFIENIGKKMKELKFPVLINPFGILYNPISVKNCIEILIKKKFFIEKDIYFSNKKYISFYHHGDFSNENRKKCIEKINKNIEIASNFLKKTSFLFITFGTSFVYENKNTKKIVSNCHKIPKKEFKNYLLNPDEIIKNYISLIENILKFNPNLEKIIFTVSPIRHWKDGANANQISKSILQIVIFELKKHFKIVDYFPSYEIVLDDLRDYRFYESDMIHPNSTAIDYIFKKFHKSFIDDKVENITLEIKKINNAKRHKPFFPYSEEHKNFKNSFLKKIKLLKNKYPFLNLKEDYDFFNEN